MANPRPLPPVQDGPLTGPFTRADLQDLMAAISRSNMLLQAIEEGLLSGHLRPNIDQAITISNQPQTVSRFGRRHNMLWVPTAQVIYVDNLSGFGAFQLVAGWNVLDLSESARLMTGGNQTVTGVYRCTDFEPSGAIV